VHSSTSTLTCTNNFARSRKQNIRANTLAVAKLTSSCEHSHPLPRSSVRMPHQPVYAQGSTTDVNRCVQFRIVSHAVSAYQGTFVIASFELVHQATPLHICVPHIHSPTRTRVSVTPRLISHAHTRFVNVRLQRRLDEARAAGAVFRPLVRCVLRCAVIVTA
jgi:hypothetical protein